MAVKKIGTLNKHQNPATNENEFDIENYMNVNWDKIKEVVDNNADELTTTQGKVTVLETDNTKNKQDISDIKENQETQNDLLQRTQSALINITTEKSDSIHVEDSSNLTAKVDVYGTSSQETRSGKNTLDINSEDIYIPNSTSLDVEGDVATVTSNNNAVTSYIAIPIKLKANTNYTFSGIAKVISNSITDTFISYIRVRQNNNGGNWVSSTSATIDKSNIGGNQNLNFTFNSIEYTEAWLWLYIKTTQVTGIISIDFSNLQIEEGTTATEYEKYGVSPSTEYPSEIENTGDNINLFDGELELGFIDGTGAVSSDSNCIRSKNFIDIKENETYTITNDKNYSNILFTYNESQELISNLGDVSTFKTPKNTKYIKFRSSSGQKENDLSVKYKIEKGNKATSYSPYKCGNIDITVCNKNLFDELWTGTTSTNFITVFAGQKYVYSENGTGQAMNFRFYESKSGSYVTKWIGANSPYIPEKNGFVKLDKTNITKTKCMLEVGEVVTEYVAHEQQTITFPLQEGQKLYKGDYPADDGIHHVRKQIKLNGTENISAYSRVYETGYGYRLSVSGGIKPNSSLYCTKYKNITFSEFYNITTNIIGKCSCHNTLNQFVYFGSSKSTLEEFKQEIAGSILEYELTEEEIEPYTPEQQEAYNKLQNVLSYKTVTNVFTDTALLEFKYVADTETWVINEIKPLKEQISTINELLSTTGTSALLLDNMQTDLESEVI